MPLPDLIRMIKGAPADVVEAARRLACSTCVLVNIGINRDDISNAHMTYFYDRGHLLQPPRLPAHAFREECASGHRQHPGGSLLLGEVQAFHRRAEDWIEPVIRDLRKVGLVREEDQILDKKAMLLKYANIIFDLERADALKTVHAYLDEIGIAYCGRYGDWGYMWTDESFISGEKAAEKALSAVVSST